jgi:hypothetical protein
MGPGQDDIKNDISAVKLEAIKSPPKGDNVSFTFGACWHHDTSVTEHCLAAWAKLFHGEHCLFSSLFCISISPSSLDNSNGDANWSLPHVWSVGNCIPGEHEDTKRPREYLTLLCGGKPDLANGSMPREEIGFVQYVHTHIRTTYGVLRIPAQHIAFVPHIGLCLASSLFLFLAVSPIYFS